MTNNNSRWLRLAVGVITLLFAGVIYAWSILKAPLGDAFGWTAAQLALNFTITMCFFCLGGMFSGLLSGKISARLRMILAAVLIFLGFFISSRLQQDGLVWLYIGYGVLGGTGIGFVYNTVISCTNAWFPDRKGLSSGLLMMGFGFSTLLLGSVAGKMIESASIGWRSTFLILGIVIGGVALLAAFFVKEPPAAAPTAAAIEDSEKDVSTKQMIRRFSFWKLFIFFILLASVGATAISFARDYTLALGASSGFAVTLVGVLSVCNGLGRLASGSIFDAIGMRKTQWLASIVVIAAPLLSLLGVLTGSLALGVVGLCLCGFSYGFSPTLSAAFVADFFGPKHFALNFSVLNLILIPASFSSTLAGQMVTSTGSYVGIFVILTAFSVVGLFINLSIKKA